MPTQLLVTLPWPPVSTNRLYATVSANTRGGLARVLVPEARAWRDEVIVRARGWGWYPPKTGDLALLLWICMPDRRRRDISNYVKLTEDALALALDFDDSRIRTLHVERQVDKANPHIQAQLYEWGPLPSFAGGGTGEIERVLRRR